MLYDSYIHIHCSVKETHLGGKYHILKKFRETRDEFSQSFNDEDMVVVLTNNTAFSNRVA